MYLGPPQRVPFALVVCLLSVAYLPAATISVTPSITPNGALFHYNYSITNGSGQDVPVIDIVVTKGVSTILNLSAPSGFLFAYDSGLGLVSFLEDTGTFGPFALSGFAFDSPLPGRPSAYVATFADGSTTSGPTTAPVPEPGALLLLGSSLVAGALWRGAREK